MRTREPNVISVRYVGRTIIVYRKHNADTLVACTGRPARLARSSLLRRLRARTGLSHSLWRARQRRSALPVRRAFVLPGPLLHSPAVASCSYDDAYDRVKSSTDAYDDVPNEKDRRVFFSIFFFFFFFFRLCVFNGRRPVNVYILSRRSGPDKRLARGKKK